MRADLFGTGFCFFVPLVRRCVSAAQEWARTQMQSIPGHLGTDGEGRRRAGSAAAVLPESSGRPSLAGDRCPFFLSSRLGAAPLLPSTPPPLKGPPPLSPPSPRPSRIHHTDSARSGTSPAPRATPCAVVRAGAGDQHSPNPHNRGRRPLASVGPHHHKPNGIHTCCRQQRQLLHAHTAGLFAQDLAGAPPVGSARRPWARGAEPSRQGRGARGDPCSPPSTTTTLTPRFSTPATALGG